MLEQGTANSALQAVENLLSFALNKGLIQPLDMEYTRNLLLNELDFRAPSAEPLTVEQALQQSVPQTATAILADITAYAQRTGIIDDTQSARELFEARIMGRVTPHPRTCREEFARVSAEKDVCAATDCFYKLCRDCDYIKVDNIARNIRFFGASPCGELEITINLSKPEKDPREIAKLKNAPQVGYPKCMLCPENVGYAGRANFPARQNHRMIPLTLGGEQWFFQYSPYLYYDEHCIVLNSKHVPMKISRATFVRLMDFVDQFPHYFLGSNADLPIVGGSILNHDHFQGGRYMFPMDRSGNEFELNSMFEGVTASVLNWPMPTISLIAHDRDALLHASMSVLDAWREYSDAECDIAAYTGTTPHNTITPIMRKLGENYRLLLVLRNNRQSDEHPLGIFHPHAELHHIKRENIGLIEVMGLFILPGRLKSELAALEDYLTGKAELTRPAEADPRAKHFDWIARIAATRGASLTEGQAQTAIREELALVCARVLADAGVYKQDEHGRAGLLHFLNSVGFTRA